jgi:ABC-type transporter Mla subunit MlaD
MSETNYLQQIANQINQITQSLDGTIAQIDKLNRGMEDNSQKLMENLTAVNENMRLIITVIKKGRTNSKEVLNDVRKEIRGEMQKLWTEKTLESITNEEMEAVKKLKTIQRDVSDNLYMQQLLGIIIALRDIVGQAKAIKLQKNKL